LNVTILPNEPDEINPLNPNTIFETQVGSDTDSTVLSENTDPKLLTHDKHCTDSTDITLLTDSVGSRVLTVNTNPTHITGPKSLTDNTDPKALTDNTDPKISTDNISDNTVESVSLHTCVSQIVFRFSRLISSGSFGNIVTFNDFKTLFLLVTDVIDALS
jgi:hypothetical protein